LRWVLLAACLAACLPQAGCGVPAATGPADSFGLDFSLPRGCDARGAIIFVVDGVNAEIFNEMLDAGDLPAIENYFIRRGTYCPRAVANTPSVTLANLTTIVTGAFPGHHGITGINWFDRNRLIWRNYETIAQKNTLDGDYTTKTLYEYFPDRTTFSVFYQAHRRATKFVENWTSAGPPFFFGWYEFVDRLTLYRLNIVAEVARRRREFPAVTVVYLLAPDFRAYAEGVESQRYRQALKHTDRQIGRVLGDLERAGLLDRLIIALTSDHSLGQVRRHFPLESFLRNEIGLDVAARHLWEKTPFEKRLEYYAKHSTVVYGSGDRYFAICLRRPIPNANGRSADFAPWPVRPRLEDLLAYPTKRGSVNLPKALIGQPAVDVVAYAAGANRVEVLTKTGCVQFAQPAGPGGPISYKCIEGEDPLAWRGKVPAELLAGAPTAGRDWLETTCDTQYPDLPAQILAYFRARHAGDIAVFAAPGWDFMNSNKAGHGGLRPEDMLVPLLLAGPGVPVGKLNVARTADLTATLLSLLGRDVPSDLDGEPLFLGQPTAPSAAGR